MAGIGWKLERLLERGSIAGAATAYGTGAAVMALPWALSTAALLAIRTIGRGAGLADDPAIDTVVGTAYAVALLVGGPIQIVVCRQVADRLYERRLLAIAGPLRRALALSLGVTALATAIVLRARGFSVGVAGAGAVLAGSVGAVWTALAVGNGIGSPGLVLFAVCAGFFASVGGGSALAIATPLGADGWVAGLVAGQGITLLVVLAGILRALPDVADEDERLAPAFREYALLGCAGLAYHASLFADEVVVWRIAGMKAAAIQAEVSTAAWLSVVPTLAWIYVEVETSFYARFRELYDALERGASLAALRQGARALSRRTRALVVGAIRVQAISTAVFWLAARPFARVLGLSDEGVAPLRTSLFAAGLQAVMLLGLIVLYYLDRRREALVSALTLAFGTAGSTAAALALDLAPSLGPVVACSAATIVAWAFADRSVRCVLEDALLDQPFGAELSPRRDAVRPDRDAAAPVDAATLPRPGAPGR